MLLELISWIFNKKAVFKRADGEGGEEMSLERAGKTASLIIFLVYRHRLYISGIISVSGRVHGMTSVEISVGIQTARTLSSYFSKNI